MTTGYIVTVEQDHELYLGDVHLNREGAEEALAWVRAEFVERYGEDGLDQEETDSDRVYVLDGPSAQLHEVAIAGPRCRLCDAPLDGMLRVHHHYDPETGQTA